MQKNSRDGTRPETNWNLTAADRAIFPALVYAGLRNNLRHYRDTIVAERNGDLAYVAWLARNILELRVWIEYCASSVANTLEFYDDALRDLVDLTRNSLDELDTGTRATLELASAALPNTKESHKYKNLAAAIRLS